MKTIKNIALFISVIALSTLLWKGLDELLKMPTVYVEYGTNKCVKVENNDPDKKYTCDNFKEASKYEHIYVAPQSRGGH